jgi:HlyD family secretion protein
MKSNYLFILPLILLASCNHGNDGSDAYGNFEATEVTISSQGNGELVSFKLDEGDDLTPDEVVGQIDTLQLYFKKEQLQASVKALHAKTIDIPSQINVLNEKLRVLEVDKNRIVNMMKDSAATQKQYDDIQGQIEITQKDLAANQERLGVSNQGLLSEVKPLQAQIDQIEDQIRRCRVVNPVNGTVLAKYAEQNEITGSGKPLYKIADLAVIYLRAYIAGDQLDDIRIGQKVKVLVDKDKDSFHTYDGEISWISDKSEFTPKIVQTKEERVNLVYAIKVKVVNDGKIKIGMPGEVKF